MCKTMNRVGEKLRTMNVYWSSKLGTTLFFLMLSSTLALAQISISFEITEPACKGLPTGSITANVTGGAGGYTYAWSSGQSTQTISGVAAGAYTLTVTDASNLTAEATIDLTEPDEILVELTADGCESPVVVTAEGLGGAGGPYKYYWGTGETTESIAVTESGQYCVTVTDANACGRVACITVEATPIDVKVTANDVTCPDGSDGSVTATPQDGTGPYTYLWSTGDSTATVDGLGTGTYTVTVTDANNCTATGSATITEPSDIIVLLGTSDPLCVGDINGSVTAAVGGGTPGYSYSWSTGDTTSTISGLAVGTYIVTITDANGCEAIDSTTLESMSEIQISTSGQGESCPDENDGSATVIASEGVAPYSYEWSNGDTTATITGLVPGVYQITVTDNVGCERIGFEIITAADSLEITTSKTDITTCGAADGTAKAMVDIGVEPLTFDWNTGATTDSIGGLSAGMYIVTVTDANDCQKVDTVTIIEPPSVAVGVDATPNICEGTTDGFALAIVAGGTAPFSFLWNTGDTTQSLTDLTAGTYIVTLTDASGCTAVDSAMIDTFPNLSVTLCLTEIVCGGRQEGEAFVEVTGGLPPYSYAWSTGDSLSWIADLGTGDYLVTVTDANGCTAVSDGRIAVIDSILIEGTISPVNCAGDSTGAIDLTIQGGEGPYTYNWSNGSTDSFLVDVPAGFYVVEVIDSNQCSSQAAFIVSEPDSLLITINKNDIECGDQATSFAGVVVTGGSPPYSINWSNNAETDTITGIQQGVYDVTVTDANECMAIASVEIVNPGAPICNIIVDNFVSNPNASDGALSALVVGGAGPYTYLWSTGDTTSTIDSLAVDIYSLTVTDSLGCETTCNINLGEFIENRLIGDYVWYDADRDGMQDSTEHGIEGIPVILIPIDTGGFILPDTVYTDENGQYLFEVPPGKYKLMTVQPDSLRLTSHNNAADTVDSDFSRDVFMTDTIMIAAGESDLTWDAGFIAAPMFDIADPCNCLNNATDQKNGQYGEVVLVVEGAIGDTWTIIDQSGMFLSDSPEPPADPIPVPIGTVLEEDPDHPGSPTYTFRHVEEIGYMIFVSNGFDTLSIGNTCFYPEITITNLPADSITICKNADPIVPEIVTDIPGIVTIYLNDEPVTVIDPSTLDTGKQVLRVEIVPFDTTECLGVYIGDVFVVTEFCPSLIGDYVWFDEDKDGMQDPEEDGVAGVEVILTPIDVVDGRTGEDTTYTDENGFYFFDILEGNYKITFNAPDDYRFTNKDVNGVSEDLDSDVNRETSMTDVFFIPGGVDSLTFDAGLVAASTLRGTPECVCLNNATTADNGQFEEIIVIEGISGDDWEVITATNAYDNASADPPAAPTPLPVGTSFMETSTGIFELIFKHVDGETFNVSVSNGIDTLSFSKTCSYPDIEIAETSGDTLIVCLNDDPFVPDLSSLVSGDYILTIDGVEVSEIDPAGLGAGTYSLVITLSPNDDEECEAVLPLTLIVTTEGCTAKIGNYVWLDENEDGIQDNDEMGIPGVQVRLSQPDGAGGFVDVDATLTDDNGEYCFEVSAGDYKVTFVKPTDDYTVTTQDAGGDDTKDSDIDADMLMTPVITIGGAESNLSLDAGFILPCINLDFPGRIGYDQMLCAPGQDPDPIIEIAAPRGGEGEIEYLWMYSESTADFSAGGFSMIPGATDRDYDPGPLQRTTHFIRCIRIVGCEDFLETNSVTITVKDDAKAEIIADPIVCYSEETTLEVVTKTPNAFVNWKFPGGIKYDVDDRNDKTIDIGFNSFGTYTISVTVMENNCETTSYFQIVATNTSTYCPSVGFAVTAEAEAETKEVRLEWEVLNDGVNYIFDVEQSSDGSTFKKIAEVKEPNLIKAGYKQYVYTDVAPKLGRNLYRVQMRSDNGLASMSNEIELMLFEPGTKVMIYPNPVQDRLMIEFAEKQSDPIEIELVSTEGSILRTMTWEANTVQRNMDFSNLPSGLYFIRIKMGSETTEVMKILKRE